MQEENNQEQNKTEELLEKKREKLTLSFDKKDSNKKDNLEFSEKKIETESKVKKQHKEIQKENKKIEENGKDVSVDNSIEDISEFPEIPMTEELEQKNSQTDINKSEIKEETNIQNNQQSNKNNHHQKNKNHNNNQQNNNQNINNNENYVINTEKVLYIKNLINSSFQELSKIAEDYGITSINRMLKSDIIFNILKKAAELGEGIFTDGYLEIVNQNFGVVKYSEYNYSSSACDIYLSTKDINKNNLRAGDRITGYVREPKKNERFFALVKLETVNGKKLDEITDKINFENLIPIFPQEKFKFESNQRGELSPRVIDLICPIGKGQRALIVAPPRTGKTVLMKSIAHAINDNHPEVELIVLLVDERPEEVTEMSRSVKGEVVSSTFDEPAFRHVELAEIVIEKAKRLVEEKKDVVILMDSITRLARAYNTTAPSSGKILTGGVDSNALQKPKRFFGAARNIENGGSLTIIATSLVETGSKMDEVIFEEFKGTGNSEIVLDRKLAERGVFPSIDIFKSGTRKEEEMLTPERLQKQWILKRFLHQKIGDTQNASYSQTKEAVEFFFDRLRKTKTNEEFFEAMNR